MGFELNFTVNKGSEKPISFYFFYPSSKNTLSFFELLLESTSKGMIRSRTF